jgi:hypothetical protein
MISYDFKVCACDKNKNVKWRRESGVYSNYQFTEVGIL